MLSRPMSSAAAALISRLPVVDAVSDYEKLHRIGEGTYGVVCESRVERQDTKQSMQTCMHVGPLQEG